jgi:signal peptidase I
VNNLYVIIVAAFIAGLLGGAILMSVPSGTAAVSTQQPQPTPNETAQPLPETAAPSDHVAEKDISVQDDKVVINVQNPVWARFAPSGSMKPVFDSGANAIEVVPTDPAQVRVGDIISYQADWLDTPVVHRVLSTGEDADGWYAVVKGDNNDSPDPGKVRWDQVRRVVIAIVY